MPITKPHSSFSSNNSGSSGALTNYLEKENKELDELSKNAESKETQMKFETMKQQFFSHDKTDISGTEVTNSIDNNKKKLGKEDAKFFAPTINFSQKEQQHLAKKIAGREINDIKEFTAKEFKAYNKALQDFAREAMNNYAKNFNRQDKGLVSGQNLLYFGKVEHMRKYKGTDQKVKEGKAKSGEIKKGLQSHIHIIVSRKDKTQAMKLTPTTKERNKVRSIGGNTYRVGFDRKEWIKANEKSFDKQFQYKRQEHEKFKNQNILKNGSPEQKAKLQKEIEKKQEQNKERGNQNELEL